MAGHHLAQINVARLIAPLDDPRIADFVANLERINALAESSPGFVWRLTGEGDNATDLAPFDDPMIIPNMSVWQSPETLGAFVYRSAHVEIMRRRREWFAPMDVFMALWWVPVGRLPTVEEAVLRLETLRRLGPTQDAFTFRDIFPAPESAQTPAPILESCE